MKITNEALSKYRQRARALISAIEKLSYGCINSTPLIQGTANEVYKRCGKSNCKCVNKAERHGPYRVIQIANQGKTKQISVKGDDKDIWEQTKQYQAEVKKYLKLKKLCLQLEILTMHIIEQRTEDFPK